MPDEKTSKPGISTVARQPAQEPGAKSSSSWPSLRPRVQLVSEDRLAAGAHGGSRRAGSGLQPDVTDTERMTACRRAEAQLHDLSRPVVAGMGPVSVQECQLDAKS